MLSRPEDDIIQGLVHDLITLRRRAGYRISKLPSLESIMKLPVVRGAGATGEDRAAAAEDLIFHAVSLLPDTDRRVAQAMLGTEGFSGETLDARLRTLGGSLETTRDHMDRVSRELAYRLYKLGTPTSRPKVSSAIHKLASTSGRTSRLEHSAAPPPRAAIFCAVQVEHQVIRKLCHSLSWDPQLGCERGLLETHASVWDVAVHATGQTNAASAAATAPVLASFQPELAVFVGVAGGFAEKGVGHLDIIVAESIHLYRSSAAHETSKPRPKARHSDRQLLNRIAILAQDLNPAKQGRVHVADLVSGDELLRSLTSETYRFIRQQYDQAIGIEMEGYGFLEAASRQRIPAVVIRGISDLLSDKSLVADASRQPAATQRAMHVVISLLSEYSLLTSATQDASRATPSIDTSREEDRDARVPLVDVSGSWHGWSIYIPVDGFFSPDREAIYRVDATFEQVGRVITLKQTLVEIYDIDAKRLEHLPPRNFSGEGLLRGDSDIVIHFRQDSGLVAGSMYLVYDTRGSGDLYGMLAVRPQIPGRPVAVKLLLRRVEDRLPSLEEIGIDRIRALG